MQKTICMAELCIRKTHNPKEKAGFAIERTCRYPMLEQCPHSSGRKVKAK
tara:strand:- start:3707 stop:3856 length:150 start_codon:yes stop_codon:yes gene_type:complete